MGIFGWSLPPGCTNRHIEEAMGYEGPCEVCGRGVDDCICPECPDCGSYGDPICYGPEPSGAGLQRNEAQIIGRKLLDEAQEAKWSDSRYADEDLDGSSHEGGRQ